MANVLPEQLEELLAYASDEEIALHSERFLEAQTAQLLNALAALRPATQGRVMSLLSPERRRQVLIAEAGPKSPVDYGYYWYAHGLSESIRERRLAILAQELALHPKACDLREVPVPAELLETSREGTVFISVKR